MYLTTDIDSHPQGKETLEQVVRALEKVQEFVSGKNGWEEHINILDSALEIGNISLGKVPADSRSYRVAEVVESLQYPSVTLNTDIESNLPLLFGRSSDLKRTLRNIIKNAEEAGAKNITVSAFANQQAMTISVADDGQGMSEKQLLSCIYGKSTKHREKGVGLKSVQTFANTYHGSVSIASRENKGTALTLTLPYKKNEQGQDIVVSHLKTRMGEALQDINNCLVTIIYKFRLYRKELTSKEEEIKQLSLRTSNSIKNYSQSAVAQMGNNPYVSVLVIDPRQEEKGIIAVARKGDYRIHIVGSAAFATEQICSNRHTTIYQFIVSYEGNEIKIHSTNPPEKDKKKNNYVELQRALSELPLVSSKQAS